MVETIATWLKENKRTVFGKGRVNIPEDMISVREFGELMWQELLKLLNAPVNVRQARVHEYNLLMDLSNAFLGKESVQAKMKLAGFVK